MTRRELLKNTAIAGLAATIPFSDGVANQTHGIKERGALIAFNVGDLQLLIVSDGHIHLSPIQPTFAPGIAPEEIEGVLKDRYVPTNHLDLGLNILVLRKTDRVVLFDTGCGYLYGPSSGKLVTNLLAAGIPREEVTDIVLTHAHIDHLGGLLDENENFVFPNATVHIADVEFAFWMEKIPDFSRSKVSGIKAEAMVRQAKKTLTAISKKLRYFKAGDVLLDCMQMELAPGHTPGHTLIRIFSGEQELIHLADISHTHTLLLAHPEWGNSFDTDFEQANETRRRVLSRVAATRQSVFSYHFPWPGVGFIKQNGTGFEWVPQSFATPFSSAV